MRCIEVSTDKFEFENDTLTLVRGGERVQSVSADAAEVLPANVNVVFAQAGTIVAFSLVEWDYLRGVIDELPVSNAEPVDAVVEAPKKRTRRSSTTA